MVGRDRYVRQCERNAFKQNHDAPKKTTTSKFRLVELRIDVVLIENKGLSEQKLMKCTNQEDEIGRIARMDHIKSARGQNSHAQHEFPEQRHAVLDRITQHPTAFFRHPVAIDCDSLEHLERGRCARSLGTDHGHLVAMPRQRARFRPYPAVERYWKIFDDNQHSATNRANARQFGFARNGVVTREC